MAILTNDLAAFHGPEWTERVTVLGEIDILVDGSVTHVLKPDPRAYQAALTALDDPDPATVVFVDDQRGNLRRRGALRAPHRLVRPGRRRGLPGPGPRALDGAAAQDVHPEPSATQGLRVSVADRETADRRRSLARR